MSRDGGKSTRLQALRAENQQLRAQLAEAEETLRAIREGEVDAIIVSGSQGEQVFSLTGTEHVYRLIVETMKEAALTVTTDGRILFCNGQFGAFVQTPMERILGRPLAEFVVPLQRPLVASLLAQSQTASVTHRMTFQGAEGSPVPAHVSATVLQQPDGLSICLVATDLTELETSTEMLRQLRKQQEALRESYAILQAVIESTTDLVFMKDCQGRYLAINSAAANAIGRSVTEILGRDDSTLFPPETARDILAKDRRVFAAGTSEIFEETLAVVGQVRYLLTAKNVCRDATGKVIGLVGISHDITERKRTEQALTEWARRLEAIRAITVEVTRELDLATLLDLIARRATELLGAASGTVWHWDEAGQALVPAAWCGLGDWRREGHYRLGEGVAGTVAQRRTGMIVNQYPTSPHARSVTLAHSRVAAMVAEPLLYHDRLIGVLAVHTDRTDRPFTEEERALLALVANQAAIAIENARLFQSVSHQQALLRTLGARLAETAESERRRLAQELHDQVGQSLTALGLTLNTLRVSLAAPGAPAVRSRLDDSLKLVEHVTERIQDIMVELRPPVLDDYGLVAALRWYGSQLASRSGLDTQVRGEEPSPRLSPAVEIALFRIAQEALTNAVKHARATRLSVDLEIEEHQIRLSIRDDGVGIDAIRSAGTDRPHWGLLGMEERAQAIGGQWRIETRPNEGTRIIVEVPR